MDRYRDWEDRYAYAGIRGGRAQGRPDEERTWGGEPASSLDFSVPGIHVGRGPRGYSGHDDRVRAEVCTALTTSGEIDASDLEVEVDAGEVTLEGHVGDRRQKKLAEAIAEQVSGVFDVHNRLRIR